MGSRIAPSLGPQSGPRKRDRMDPAGNQLEPQVHRLHRVYTNPPVLRKMPPRKVADMGISRRWEGSQKLRATSLPDFRLQTYSEILVTSMTKATHRFPQRWPRKHLQNPNKTLIQQSEWLIIELNICRLPENSIGTSLVTGICHCGHCPSGHTDRTRKDTLH